MPSYIGKATDAFFDAINTGSSIVKDYTENEARFATTTKKYNLQADINNEMQKIAMNGNYTTWQTDINNFFEKVKGQMSDPNSQYYCKNNLQAKMFNEVLNDSLVSVGNRVSMMVMQKQLSQMGVDRDQAINRLIEQGITGNDFVQKANEIDDAFWLVNGNVNPDEKQATRESRVLYGYESERRSYFNKFKMDAIRNGDSFETLWDMTKTNASVISATNENGTPMAIDFNGIDTKLEKELKSDFLAAQKDYQKENAKQLSMIYQKLNQATDDTQRVNIAKDGQRAMNLMKEHDLSEDDRNKYSQYFKLSDPNISQSSAESAIKKLTPKERMEYFIHAWQRGAKSEMGGAKNLYSAYDAFKKITLEEIQEARGNPDLQWNDIEKECPTYMEFLEYAKENLPPSFQNVIKNAETVVGTIVNTKDDKNLYKAEMDKLSDWLYDLLFETNVSDLDGPELEKLNKRVATAINSIYGGLLEKQKDYSWLKKEPSMKAITGYEEGVIGNEKRLAQALQARDANPDLWYKDMYGTDKRLYDSKTEAGLTYIEAAEKQEIAKYLKYNEGVDVDIGTIGSQLDEEGAHDIQARKVYTVGNNQYRFRSDDGKTVIMEKKPVGSDKWEQTKMAKEQEKYDSPRQTAKRAVQDIDVSKVPPFEVPGSGVIISAKYSQEQWNEMNSVQKKNIIMKLLKKYPDEMQEWLNEQPDKKKK